MKIFKYLMILIGLFLLVYPLSFASALEVVYPDLPGIALGNTSLFPEYIRYVFIFAFMVAGIIGVISIAIAGFQKLLYAGSPAKSGEANERIRNAILGIIILMSSFIILTTINPSLVNPTTIGVSIEPGVYLVSGGCSVSFNDSNNRGLAVLPFTNIAYAQTNCLIELAPETDNDFSPERTKGLDGIWNNCATSGGTDMLVWLYDQPNWIITQNSTTVIVPCGGFLSFDSQTTGFDVLSHYWDYDNGGIRYFMTPDCTGLSSYYDIDSPGQTVSDDIPWFNIEQIDDPNVDQTVHSVWFSPDPDQSFYWLLILTQGIELQDECNFPITNNPFMDSNVDPITGGLCVRIGDPNYPQTFTLDGVPFNPYSAIIEKQDANPNTNPRNQGLTFWSNSLQYTLYQTGILDDSGNLDPMRNIGFMWQYDQNSPPAFTDVPINPSVGGPPFFPNDGNPDNFMKFFGTQANGDWPPVPEDESRGFRQELGLNQISGTTYDCTYDKPSVAARNGCHSPGRGMRTSLNKVTWDGNYKFVLYTHNEAIKKRGCKVFDDQSGQPLFYDGSITPPFSNLPEIFTQFQTGYGAVVFPSYD